LGALIIALLKRTKYNKKAMTVKELKAAFKDPKFTKQAYKMRKDMIILSFSVIYGSLAMLWGVYMYTYKP
jgi:hypothetical protein